jgi:GST-like protein
MIDLYFFPTPNGKKVTIALEEMGQPYTIKPLDIGKGAQFDPDYLKISPNGRMPAILDHAPLGGGGPVAIFESGAILMYLAEKSGKFWPQDIHKKYEVVQWVMWQMAGQGPKFGEQGHFQRAMKDKANGDLAYAMRRFDDEVHRLFGVMNLGLFQKRYLAAGEYTIADMICYPWASSWNTRGIDLKEFPNVARWLDELSARPAVQKGMEAGAGLMPDFSKLPTEERDRLMKESAKVLTNQRARAIPKEWQDKTP